MMNFAVLYDRDQVHFSTKNDDFSTKSDDRFTKNDDLSEQNDDFYNKQLTGGAPSWCFYLKAMHPHEWSNMFERMGLNGVNIDPPKIPEQVSFQWKYPAFPVEES